MPWNRCQFHLSKNAQQYARRKEDKPRIAQAMRDIFDAPSREDAEELKGKVVKKFEKIAPEFVSWLEDNVDEGLTVFDFPRSWWRRIRTINGLERLHREIRRRTRVVGIFPHEASALCYVARPVAWLLAASLAQKQGFECSVPSASPRVDRNGTVASEILKDDQGRRWGAFSASQPLGVRKMRPWSWR